MNSIPEEIDFYLIISTGGEYKVKGKSMIFLKML